MQNLLERKKFKHGSNKAFSDWENYFSPENDELLVFKNISYHYPEKNNQIMVHNISDQDILKEDISVNHEPFKVLSWKDITLEKLVNLHEYEVTENKYENMAGLCPENVSSNTSKILHNQDEAKSKENYYQERYVTNLEDGSHRCSVQKDLSCATIDYVHKNLDRDDDKSSLIDEKFEQNIMAIFDQDFLFGSQTMLIPSQNTARNQEISILSQRSENKEIPASSEVVSDSQEMISLSQDISGIVEITSSQESYGSQTMIVSSQESAGNQTMVVSSQESSSGETMILSSQESKGVEKMIVSSQESSESQKMIISSQESSESMKMVVSSQESLESQNMIVASLENAVSSHEMFANQILGVPDYGRKWMIAADNMKSYTNEQVYFSKRKESFHKFSGHNLNFRKRQKSNKYYLKPRKYLKSEDDC